MAITYWDGYDDEGNRISFLTSDNPLDFFTSDEDALRICDYGGEDGWVETLTYTQEEIDELRKSWRKFVEELIYRPRHPLYSSVIAFNGHKFPPSLV